jgi:hypothetical protein
MVVTPSTAASPSNAAEANFVDCRGVDLRSGRFTVELMGIRRGRSIYRDPAGFHGLRNFASKIDAEKAIFKRRVLDLDIICQIELAPEVARGNTPMDIFSLFLLGFLTFDCQNILFSRDGDVVGTEARDRQRNPVAVFVKTFDVIRRVVVVTTAPASSTAFWAIPRVPLETGALPPVEAIGRAITRTPTQPRPKSCRGGSRDSETIPLPLDIKRHSCFTNEQQVGSRRK